MYLITKVVFHDQLYIEHECLLKENDDKKEIIINARTLCIQNGNERGI